MATAFEAGDEFEERDEFEEEDDFEGVGAGRAEPLEAMTARAEAAEELLEAAQAEQAALPARVAAFLASLHAQFVHAAHAITSDPKVGLLGAMQSLFEASMYSFVFLWTPALSPRGEDLPHGMIFATFMLSSMIGSSIASRLLVRTDTRPEVFMQRVFAVAAAALSVPVLVAASGIGAGPEWARTAAGSIAGVRRVLQPRVRVAAVHARARVARR